jgi:hypothetical protein
MKKIASLITPLLVLSLLFLAFKNAKKKIIKGVAYE